MKHIDLVFYATNKLKNHPSVNTRMTMIKQ